MASPSSKPSDPANPANPNQNHTPKDGTKPTSGFTAITDTDFVPTLDAAPPTRYLQSFMVLTGMIGSMAFAAYYMKFDIFQTTLQQYAILGVVVTSLFYTGVVWIDWWEVAVGYWWLSFPVLGLAGLLLVRMDEATVGIDDAA